MNVIEKNLKWAYALTPRSTTTHLIIHHAAGEGSVENIHAFHLAKGWAGIAYHYYVRRDGTVYRGRPENMRGGHTTNWNYCSIGACFEGNFEGEKMSAAQEKAGAELIADIVSRHPGITVGRHRDYGQTACPGKNFPFDEMLKGGNFEPEGTDAEHEAEPDAWAKVGCDWAVKNGLFVGDGTGNFHWHDTMTRQELANVLMRMA
ncbi:MAG: peptidoglycan recognition family protein, partial [Oscillospiraceae bacterium]